MPEINCEHPLRYREGRVDAYKCWNCGKVVINGEVFYPKSNLICQK